MNRYAGEEAVVEQLRGVDDQGCRLAMLRHNGTPLAAFAFRTRDLEYIGIAPPPAPSTSESTRSLAGDTRIVAGARVIVHKHRPVNGNANWSSDMDKYVGKAATVVSHLGRDKAGCAVARISVDGTVVSDYSFRIRDLEYVPPCCVDCGDDSSDLDGDSRIVEGATVIIRKHRPVNGGSNWVSGMDRYVGKEATVVSLLGKDQASCEVARVAVDGATVTNYSFRVRDLEFVSAGAELSSSLDGDSRIVVGSKVIVHRHRPVEGETNWVSNMDKYADKEAIVVSITGKDRQQCKMAQLSVDGVKITQYKFRVRDLELAAPDTSLDGDSRIVPGVVVVIHKHRPVNGNLNWTSAMDSFVGKYAVVSELTGKDGAGCRVARVVIDGKPPSYCFRTRDLELVGSGLIDSLEGDDKIKVGSKVIISKHRSVCFSSSLCLSSLYAFSHEFELGNR